MTSSSIWTSWSSLENNWLKFKKLPIILEEAKEYIPQIHKEKPKDHNMLDLEALGFWLIMSRNPLRWLVNTFWVLQSIKIHNQNKNNPPGAFGRNQLRSWCFQDNPLHIDIFQFFFTRWRNNWSIDCSKWVGIFHEVWTCYSYSSQLSPPSEQKWHKYTTGIWVLARQSLCVLERTVSAYHFGGVVDLLMM